MSKVLRKPLPLAVEFTRGRSPAAGMQSMVNLYPEPVKREGRTQIVLYPMPGREVFAMPAAKCRGQIDVGETEYSVNGTRLYQIAADGTTLDLGEIEGEARVELDYNGAQLVIVAELKSYVLDSSLVLSEITDPDFLHPNSVASINRTSVFTRADTDEFDWAQINDATAYDALDFASAETNADPNICVRQGHGLINFFGTRTLERFQYTGSAAQVFSRLSLSPVEIGWLAKNTILLVDGEFMGVGRDGKSGGVGVYRTKGYGCTKVSPPGLDLMLTEYGDNVGMCHAISFQILAHQFYALTLPGRATVTLDLATQQWVYQVSGTYPMSAEPGQDWDAETFATNGNNLIIGSSDGNLHRLDHTLYTDNGNPIVREVTCPQLSLGGDTRGTMWRLGLDMQMGVGLDVGQGSDPKVMMACSKDGGRFWSQPREATLGKVGKNLARAVWNNLGDFTNMIVKFRVTDPVFTAFLGAWHETEVHG